MDLVLTQIRLGLSAFAEINLLFPKLYYIYDFVIYILHMSVMHLK